MLYDMQVVAGILWDQTTELTNQPLAAVFGQLSEVVENMGDDAYFMGDLASLDIYADAETKYSTHVSITPSAP